MGRARGANAKLVGAFETTYATVPGSGFLPLPFASFDLGPTQGLIEDDLLGNGREKFDPTRDVVENDGSAVVPVDVRNFGHWLKLLFGVPTTTGSGPYTHVFASGAQSLPSMSLEGQVPDVPSFEMNYGARANTLRIAMARRGLLNSTIGLIAKGASARTSTTGIGGSLAAALPVSRFRQATGEIKREGVAIGSIVSSELSYTNNLDKVETIQPDGEIEDADPGQAMASASIVTRFDSNQHYTDAVNGTPVELSFGWTQGAHSLLFTMERVFLPRVRQPIQGPGGIQATMDVMASGQDGNCLTATLVNDVDSYS